MFYESPKRVSGLLGDLVNTLGGGRQAAVCRELTKRFEEVSRGSLDQLAADFADRTVKGEIVVLVDRAPEQQADAATVEQALDQALTHMTMKDAATAVAQAYGLPRRDVYQLALRRAGA
jgi:16S rRNA (cytidine1402-2'-O)-methyltransferase